MEAFPMPADCLGLLNERVLIFDGAMGTNIHRYHPTDADWGGAAQINNCDYVAITHPEWIYEIHKGFLEVGCDAIETNTFNGSTIVMSEFGLGDRVEELNRRNIQIAKDAVKACSTAQRPRFVVGSVGPSTKNPSILNDSLYISFDEMYAAYKPQMRAFVEEGVDAILIETCFDILQSKIAAICAIDTMREKGVRLPLMVQVTILDNNAMLAGSDILTALTTLETFQEIDVIGMNCALGPELMFSHVQTLSKHCRRRISVLPNAGMPNTVNNVAVFPLTPPELAEWLSRFVHEYGVNIVGGCCGTTHEHLAAVVKALHGVKAPARNPVSEPSVTCLHSTVALQQDPRPLLVGERTNTNGSRKFKQLLEKEDWQGLVEMAQEQEREGTHVLDVCVDYVGRDGVRDMHEVVKRYNFVLTKPLMLDSTEVPVIEAGLRLCSGKAIINSINLEDGRKTLDPKTRLAKRYGAALVALTIDEKGQADTAEWKFEVARRIYDIVVNEYGIPPSDLLFDTLVFPVTTGQEQTRKSAIATFEAIRLIKENLPGALTHLGLSNCSFGLSPYTRQVLNSVYLHYALEYGLDSAILHAAKIMPLSAIDEKGKELCRRLLFDERKFDAAGNCIEDPLQMLIEHYADKKTDAKKGGQSLG